MSVQIPYPPILRRTIATQPPTLLTQGGEFTNAVYYIWNKFNVQGGINLNGFKHNCRNYYDEDVPITQFELQHIRGLLSDPQLQIVVSPAGKSFGWDERNNVYYRKIIYIDEAFLFLFTTNQTEQQLNALRIIFMSTLFHLLGDYITAWMQPNIDLNPDSPIPRVEGGSKTEYAFFGGTVGGFQSDGIHYDYAKIRLFNPQGQGDHFLIPDAIAKHYYGLEVIHRFTEQGLQRNNLITGPTTTIRQLDLCCGHHRLNWRPPYRPENQPPQYIPPGYAQSAQPGGPGAPPFFPPQPPQAPFAYNPQAQQQFNQMRFANPPGTTGYPTAANFGYNMFPPPALGMQSFCLRV